jgi:predicted ATPase
VRSAKTKDYWKKVNSRNYTNYLKEIDLNNHNGIKKIQLDKGIYAICGLNGAGKTTIISAIKDLLGIPKTKHDITKLGSSVVTGIIKIGGNEIQCSNTPGNKSIDVGIDKDMLCFIDYEKSQQTMDFFISQANLDELIEQNEEIDIVGDDLSEISCLVGKEYAEIKMIEVEELIGLEVLPFFKVKSYGINYDTRNMGIGEHFLIYIFWCLNKMSSDSIVIIEEPETFIGIVAQRNLMDYLAKIIIDKGISIIITTHSPFILENIKNSNISIIGRVSDKVSIIQPNLQLTTYDILCGEKSVDGTIFVEDNVAEMFLILLLEDMNPSILRDYTIQSVGGESNISKCLQFVNYDKIKYNFIGVYDGDMSGKINKDGLNWSFTFLPIKTNVESEMKEILHKGEYIKSAAASLNISEDNLVIILSKIDGENYHDWFIDLCRHISIDKMLVLRCLYRMWKSVNQAEIDTFIKQLNDLC